MIGILQRKFIDIRAIRVPDLHWELVLNTKLVKQWIDPEQSMGLAVNFFNHPPNLPSISNVDQLRDYYRKSIVRQRGGLVEVDFTRLDHLPAVRTILKVPQAPSGIQYLASLTIPFETCSYVVKIQAPEAGLKGARETFMLNELLHEGKVHMGDDGPQGWTADPYDPEFRQGTLRNQSENEIYDQRFPQHPLTRSRQLLARLESEISFSPRIGHLKPFGH